MAAPSVVLDTNVVVSAHLSALGPSFRIYHFVLLHRLRLFVSEPIIAEYEAVLLRPKFRIPSEKVAESLALIRTCATVVLPAKRLAESVDEPDNRFLECAEAAAADYLVTGNRGHFPAAWKRTRVVTPRELLETLYAI
jgi:uncharacterized protein